MTMREKVEHRSCRSCNRLLSDHSLSTSIRIQKELGLADRMLMLCARALTVVRAAAFEAGPQ